MGGKHSRWVLEKCKRDVCLRNGKWTPDGCRGGELEAARGAVERAVSGLLVGKARRLREGLAGLRGRNSKAVWQ